MNRLLTAIITYIGTGLKDLGITDFINFHLNAFGFSSFNDFSESTFRISSLKSIAFVSVSLGTFFSLVQDFIGISVEGYTSFIILLLMEFITGIRASIRKGNKIQSRKFGRVIVKISTYTLLLGAVYNMSKGVSTPSFIGLEVNIYQWIHAIILNMVTIQLIISVLENLSEMGYEETSQVFRFISSKFKKWFELKNNEE